MDRVVAGIIAVCLSAGASAAEETSWFRAPDPAVPTVMFFSGGDLWHTGSFAHGGLLWSPGGLTAEGFTLKLLAGVGTYRYLSGGVEVNGFGTLGSVMPGWRFKADKFELTTYAGLDVQDHRLSPNDLGNDMRGTNVGLRAGADVWYEPAHDVMLAANVSASTIGPSYWTRIAAGWRIYGAFWLGPELQGLGGPTYHQFRAGAHVTSFKSGAFEWSMGMGFAIDTDNRTGARPHRRSDAPVISRDHRALSA